MVPTTAASDDWEPTRVQDAELLYDVAHARAGDKGDTSNIVVIPFEEDAYDALLEVLTEERVKRHFGDLVTGEVERYPIPHNSCFNFVLRGALDGGVTRSLRLDPHGKSLSRHMLTLPLED